MKRVRHHELLIAAIVVVYLLAGHKIEGEAKMFLHSPIGVVFCIGGALYSMKGLGPVAGAFVVLLAYMLCIRGNPLFDRVTAPAGKVAEGVVHLTREESAVRGLTLEEELVGAIPVSGSRSEEGAEFKPVEASCSFEGTSY